MPHEYFATTPRREEKSHQLVLPTAEVKLGGVGKNTNRRAQHEILS
jgi:hypothetical protein